MRKRKILIGSMGICLVIFSGCGNRAQVEKSYEITASKVGQLMISQAEACISQSRAYQAVWEYAKVSDMDFKSAAKEMLGPQTSQNKATMVENKSMIESLLEDLKEPPAKFEETHKKLEELYEIYVKLHDLAMDPLDDMDKHMKSVGELSDQIAEKARELNAALIVK